MMTTRTALTRPRWQAGLAAAVLAFGMTQAKASDLFRFDYQTQAGPVITGLLQGDVDPLDSDVVHLTFFQDLWVDHVLQGPAFFALAASDYVYSSTDAPMLSFTGVNDLMLCFSGDCSSRLVLANTAFWNTANSGSTAELVLGAHNLSETFEPGNWQLTPVPEPTPLPLAAAGMLTLAAAARRRRAGN